jgi:tRNA A-37 threonylcarbamoyl transferase component Bud32
MHEIKDTRRAIVRVGYDGKVHKRYLGPECERRYANEVSVLRYLEKKGCDFVPRLIEDHPDELYIVTSNCGQVVDKISQASQDRLFRELEQYGIQHNDPFPRNITYDARRGRFCVIDFEFATNLETGEGLLIEEVKMPIADGLPDDPTSNSLA